MPPIWDRGLYPFLCLVEESPLSKITVDRFVQNTKPMDDAQSQPSDVSSEMAAFLQRDNVTDTRLSQSHR
jgi:hypothetical protein